MAYDEALADRVRGILAGRQNVEEKRMFGGLTFMVNGGMCCGVLKDDLVLRLDPDRADALLSKPNVRPMDFTGRPMKGMLYIGPGGYGTDEALRTWLDEAVAFASSQAEGGPKKGRR